MCQGVGYLTGQDILYRPKMSKSRWLVARFQDFQLRKSGHSFISRMLEVDFIDIPLNRVSIVILRRTLLGPAYRMVWIRTASAVQDDR